LARGLTLLLLATLAAPAGAVKPSALVGTWEAVRTPEDERLFIRLLDQGKVEIVAEYDFEIPGQSGKRRGRSTTFGKWSVKGDEVVLSYAKVRERLRYEPRLPLSQIGLEGAAAALQPVGKADSESRIRGAILWKAPHDYKLAPAPQAAAPAWAAPSN
jgi:hypothetical protein